MKTITKVLFALLFVSVVLLASCNEDAVNNLLGEHTHTFEEKWTYDETHHWHCATCEHTEEVSDKAPHSWDDGEISVAATHTADGVKTYTCTVCGATKTEVIPMVTDHDYEWKVEERNGSKIQYRECSVSGCDEMHYFGEEYEEYFTVTDGAVSVRGEKRNSLPKDVKVPTIVNGNVVTSVASGAFAGINGLESVEIPLSVTTIRYNSFPTCPELKSVSIPASVTSIESAAFVSCASLTSITIPESVTSLGSNAFSASALTSVTILGPVSEFGGGVFANCTSLTTVCISGAVTVLGVSAFGGDTNLTAVTLPDSLTTIGTQAFEGCSSLEELTIPSGVTGIGNNAFGSCDSLTDIYFGGTRAAWDAMSTYASVPAGCTVHCSDD